MVQNAKDMELSLPTEHEEVGVENDKERRQWWKKVVDVEEGKNQILFAVPLILTNGAYFFIPLISVMFAGHLGDVELAASNLANSWSNVTGFMFMKCKQTWQGFSLESFCHVLPNLKLALPSAAMLCLEFWAFEVMVLLAGLLPNPEITTPLIAMCTNTETAAYMVVYGFSAAVSTRVSNELGAGNPDKSKHAFGVTLKLSMIIGLVTVLALGFGHDIWARLFSDNPVIISKFASMIPFLLIGTSMDTVQGVLTGVARGCGWQNVAVYINLATFYLIGLPTAVILAFKIKLHAKGLYIGIMCGLFCQTGSLLLLTQFKKWKRVDLPGNNNVENAIII